MSTEDAFISYDRVVHQSGSASLLALGMAVVLLGIVFGWFYNSLEAITIAVIIAMISIIASFLFIIKQYQRWADVRVINKVMGLSSASYPKYEFLNK